MVKKVKANLAGGVMKVKPNMAIDIVESKILTNLPVKSLIRFSSACKSWYSLLSDPYFINMYNQIQKNKISNLLLINKGLDGKDIVVKRNYSRKQSKTWSFSDTINFTYRWVRVMGCCDGVVCVGVSSSKQDNFSTKHHISLWNPALRINKIIASYDKNPWFYLCVGFGHHNQTKDYNVITFTNYDRLENVRIYSLASNSWRKIELAGPNQLLTDKYVVEPSGVYVSCYPSEAYCWLAHKMDDHDDGDLGEYSIISFHTKEEAFKELMLPNYTDTRGVQALFIYKDSLAVLHTRNSDASPLGTEICTIWVMKEYGDAKSWTKLCNFDSRRRSYVSFVGVIETDQILLQIGGYDNKEVNVVDIEKSQMKPTRYTKDITKARWVSSFTESLVLLKGVH